MSLYTTSLNSGSNGNCYYIGNDNEAILVDAGLSCKETERRMHRLGLSMHKVKALFISHEHTDHIKGITIISKKYKLPVYITPATQRSGGLTLSEQEVIPFQAYTPIQIGSLTITAFPKFHDAIEPHSFIISGNDTNIGVFTDIGTPCEHLIKHFEQCHAAFLEANYDEEMLEHGRYPYHLKKRISGGHGHLSNKQALELFKKHRPPFMSHLFLSHLSKDNNDPDVVLELFRPHAEGIHVAVASRYQEIPVYHISANGSTIPLRYTQLSIF